MNSRYLRIILLNLIESLSPIIDLLKIARCVRALRFSWRRSSLGSVRGSWRQWWPRAEQEGESAREEKPLRASLVSYGAWPRGSRTVLLARSGEPRVPASLVVVVLCAAESAHIAVAEGRWRRARTVSRGEGRGRRATREGKVAGVQKWWRRRRRRGGEREKGLQRERVGRKGERESYNAPRVHCP